MVKVCAVLVTEFHL